MQHHTPIILALATITAAPAFGQAVTTFDNGTEGWSVSGRDDIAATGNPGNGLDVVLFDVFGADIRNNTNADFLGDYSRFTSPIELSIDIKANSIDFFGTPVSRELALELRDYDDSGLFLASTWISLGVLNPQVNDDWVTYSVVIEDTTAMDLPSGWRGAGAEDPDTFEPILPDGRTFANVLENVDEIAFTTFVPGFFFGFSNFDIQVDNVALRVIPAPGTAALALAGLPMLARRRR